MKLNLRYKTNLIDNRLKLELKTINPLGKQKQNIREQL